MYAKAVILETHGPVATSPQLCDKLNETLVHIRTSDLDHSELLTHHGTSTNAVSLSRVLCIEYVGTVSAAPRSEATLLVMTVVIPALDDMVRTTDGACAKYCIWDWDSVTLFAKSEMELGLPWEIIGALLGLTQTAWWLIPRSLGIKKG